jgi:hypothetical protein
MHGGSLDETSDALDKAEMRKRLGKNSKGILKAENLLPS